MARESKAAKAERQEAINQLREWIKPGDTVYTILDHVSSSGMSRAIRVVIPYVEKTYPNLDMETGRCVVECECTFGRGSHGDFLTHHDPSTRVDFTHPNYAVGKALGLRHWKRNGHEQDALVVGGCGMDMGFHLVYELSSVLYGGRWCPECGYLARTPINPNCQTCKGTGQTGGYACLGKGKCPSNYHVNHRDRIRCEGVTVGEDRRFCWKPDRWSSRYPVPEDWPEGPAVDIGEGQTIRGPLLACLSGSGEDGKPYEVCPTCKGAGDLPNPEGPERFDLQHYDGYAIRHRWL